MILNHKVALEYIFNEAADYKLLSVAKVEDIHRLLVTDLNIGFKDEGVYFVPCSCATSADPVGWR